MVDEIELENARWSARSSTQCDVVEVVTRGERRRHRSEDERATSLSEVMAPGAIVAQLAPQTHSRPADRPNAGRAD